MSWTSTKSRIVTRRLRILLNRMILQLPLFSMTGSNSTNVSISSNHCSRKADLVAAVGARPSSRKI